MGAVEGKDVARLLNGLNRRFYETQAQSFSATRQQAWAGWERLAQLVQEHVLAPGARAGAGKPLRVLDVGCGNLRFERFLAKRFPGVPLDVLAVDACDLLAADVPPGVRFRSLDVMEALYAGRACEALAAAGAPARAFDLVACNGFFHHVFGQEARRQLMQALVHVAAPGGLVQATFWRFLDDPASARKADAEHAEALAALAAQGVAVDDACFAPGDRLLGWQGRAGVCRYCHSFAGKEVDALAAAVAPQARAVAVYDADGRTGAANRYLVLQRNAAA